MEIKIKKLYAVFAALIAMFSLAAPAFARDVLNLPTESISGKFETVTGGLVIIEEKGTRKSYIKTQKQSGEYSDYITYRKSPFSGGQESSPCEVLFIDTFIVRVKVPGAGIVEIPRYRVSDLEINIK